jgi:putative IMPACT (imprinted ancient) family translation regulator
VVVTRYFGGTKLGTGGLVRAYGDAVRQVVAIAERAHRVSVHTVSIALPYALFEQGRKLAESHAGVLLGQDFAAEVTLTARFPVERLGAFQSALNELSCGTCKALIVETSTVLMAIPPA